MELRLTQGGTAVTSFTLAVDGRKKQDGTRDTDFISCVAFSKQAEIISKYVSKGQRLGVVGRIMTGSFERDGKKVYTTDVVVEEFDFIEKKNQSVMTPHELQEIVDDDDLPF
jgi:single-strand DNA-binding protein